MSNFLNANIKIFFRKPAGTGSALNVYMFTGRNVGRHVKTLVSDPRYFCSRIAVMYHQFVNPSAPWLTNACVRFLERTLHEEMVGFEWGSGRSTVWLANRLKHVTSIEHDAYWFNHVQSLLTRNRIGNVDLRLAALVEKSSNTYANEISRFPDGHFDFILVDGAERNRCITAARSKVKNGGYIVVDNAEQCDLDALAEYKYLPTSNGVWRSDVFIRS